jgi:hypothetical protein
MHKRFPILIALVCVAFFAIAFLSLPRGADAQCGSSASSCKNCHEIQGKAPVNTVGAWHTQHAFGDFCEFCHAGNVKAKDQTAAHAGMLDPLMDVKGSCQSCHPENYLARAQTYGEALGKPIGEGGGSAQATPAAGAAATTGGGNSNAAAASDTAACGPALPTSGQVIDVNAVYAGLDEATKSMLGNAILLGLIGAVLVVLFGLVWHFEKPLPRLLAYLKKSANEPVLKTVTPEGIVIPISAEAMRRPEYRNLERALAQSDAATVGAVSKLLQDRENAPKILKALGNMDLKSLAALSDSDPQTLEALLAFAKEMKFQQGATS